MIKDNNVLRNGSVVAAYGYIEDETTEFYGPVIIWLCDWDEPTFDERLEMSTIASCNSMFEETSTFGYTALDFKVSRATGYIHGQPYWAIY